MPAADRRSVRREDGFTLIELVVVLVIMAILLAVAVGFQASARERAADATARSNIRTAVPAIEAFRADVGTYAGMTLATLQTSYSPGVEGITVLSSGSAAYCVSATAAGSTWYKAGPDGPITQTACS
jgi:prepilin-type N-terminal cleavage/methylation domain-containing protein